MNRGYFTAASGMLTQQRILDTLGNNISNINTPGFKRDILRTTTFNDFLLSRLESQESNPLKIENSRLVRNDITNLKKLDIIRYPEELYTVHSQSSFDETGRVFDFAIYGNGFFSVEEAGSYETIDDYYDEEEEREYQYNEEQVLLTRNGQFWLDENGYLRSETAGRVLGEEGPIQLVRTYITVDGEEIQTVTADFTVDQSGYVYIPGENDGEPVNRFLIVCPEDYSTLVKYDEGYWNDTSPDTQLEADDFIFEMRQNCLEHSNVDATREMTNMIASSKLFSTCSRVLKIIDELNERSVTELARLK